MRTATERISIGGSVETNWKHFANLPRVVMMCGGWDTIVPGEYDSSVRKVGSEFTVKYKTGEERVYQLEGLDNINRTICWSLVSTTATPAETDGLRYTIKLGSFSSVTSGDSTLVEWQVAVSHNASDEYFRFVSSSLLGQLQQLRTNIDKFVGRATLRTSTDGLRLKRSRDNNDDKGKEEDNDNNGPPPADAELGLM